MPTKDEATPGTVWIQTGDGYQKIGKIESVELTPQTDQERLNQMAVDALREILPDNMELVMHNGR
jgi:hypothetical protein